MTTDIIKATKMALEKMDKDYCTLSQIDYSKLDDIIKESAKKEKYLERPFAYEFYHQLRKLMDCGTVDFGDCVIQAEVDKRYQHCFEKGKIPDFIIHVPGKKYENVAVLEFKLTSNLGKIKDDFEKLVEFRTNSELKYERIIEVIIGSKDSLKRAKKRIETEFNNVKYKGVKIIEEVTIIEFDTDSDSWKAEVWDKFRQ